jgi:serine/threonine protein phosphatase PrpC
MAKSDQEGEGTRRRQTLSAVLRTDDFKPAAALVRAEFGARSHRGRVYQDNDDHYLVVRLARHQETLLTSLASVDLPNDFDEYAYAAVVADGIGRAGTGSVAARLAISTLAHLALRFGQWNVRIDPGIASEIIERSEWFYRRTHETVLQRSQTDAQLAGMSATLTSIYSAGTDLFVAHVGHSRCYLFRGGVLVQLTRDQTLRERRAAAPHPIPVGQAIEDVQHILTNVIGARVDGPGVIVEHFRLADDDTLLLCTNGLTDVVSDDAIADVLASRRTQAEQCDLLMDLALENGAADNTTAVLVNYRVPQIKES